MNNTKKGKNDIEASCTHDEIIQFITQQNKTNYSRNIFTGTLDIINDVVKETYHTEAHNECQDCGQYISYSDDFILNAPANFKWSERVFDVVLLETEIQRYTHRVFADTPEEAISKALKGDSEVIDTKRVETSARENDDVTERMMNDIVVWANKEVI